MTLHVLWRASLIGACLLFSGRLERLAAAQNTQPRTISVAGQGKVSAAPNVAEISMGVASRAATAREALASNNERMAALQQLLKDRGVATRDIQTSQFAVQPLQSQPPPYQPGQQQADFVPKVIGYQVQNSVRIRVRDLRNLGVLLDAVVAGGANQVYGVDLRNDDDKFLNEARKKAMADARQKAELLAGEAQMVVGMPVSIREDSGPSFAAVPAAPPGVAYAPAAPPSSVPVAPGEQEMRVIVHVVYELKGPS